MTVRRGRPLPPVVRPLAVAVRGGPVDVPVWWSGPQDRPARGLVLLVHGFTRHPRFLSDLASRLAEQGVASARPHVVSLRRRRGLLDPAFLTAMVLALATTVEDGLGRGDPLPDSGIPVVDDPALVTMGHSAGAAVAVHAAAVLTARAGPSVVRGMVLLDGADTVTGLAAAALPGLERVPVRVISGPSSRCNRGGELTARVASARQGFLGVEVTGGGHGDAEDGAAGRPGAVYRWACGDRTAPEDRLLVHRLAVDWARGLLAQQPDPAPSGESATLLRWEADGRVRILRGSAPQDRPPAAGRPPRHPA